MILILYSKYSEGMVSPAGKKIGTENWSTWVGQNVLSWSDEEWRNIYLIRKEEIKKSIFREETVRPIQGIIQNDVSMKNWESSQEFKFFSLIF